MDASDLVLHVRFNSWASLRTLEAACDLSREELVRDMKTSHNSILGTLAHIFIADRIWWSRLEGHPRATLTDPGESLDTARLKNDWPALLERYIAWAETADWDGVVAYSTTTGLFERMPARRVVLHLVNHDSYHRGQLATLLRQVGRVPPALDLIAFYRSLSGASAQA